MLHKTKQLNYMLSIDDANPHVPVHSGAVQIPHCLGTSIAGLKLRTRDIIMDGSGQFKQLEFVEKHRAATLKIAIPYTITLPSCAVNQVLTNAM